MGSSDLPIAHFSGAAIAALLNFPLWRYATMAQAKYEVAGVGRATWGALLGPPYRGVMGIVGGMTVARGGIFLLSDVGTKALRRRGVEGPAAVVLPPLAASAVVQVLKQPIVRGGVMLQNPTNPSGTLLGTLRLLAATRGPRSLWHGTSAGLLKTAPKYCVAIAAKDALEKRLPRAATPGDELLRDAAKASVAAVCGAVLTNPLDVLRNEMFKTDLGFFDALAYLNREHPNWIFRGAKQNLVAVAAPVGATIFFTDQLKRILASR